MRVPPGAARQLGLTLIDPPGAFRPSCTEQKPTILVVEDEVLVRLMLGDALREQDFAVIEAANADEAIAVLRSATRIDLVLSDIRMPGPVDGIALARMVRDEFPNLKIVLASAYLVHPTESDAHAFIRKPYNVVEVTRRIRELIGQ